MLSIFPDLLTFWLLAPFILRVTIGLIFIYFGVSKIWKEKHRRINFFKEIGAGLISFWIVSIVEIIGGAFLVLGIFTQPTAIVLLFITLAATYIKTRKPDLLDNSIEFYMLSIAVLLSLVFLGPGFWAIDLPL